MAESIQNLKTYDPFADEGDEEEEVEEKEAVQKPKQSQHIHLRVQKRTGRKMWTTIQGLPSELDLKKLLKHFKKDFCCNGTIAEDEEWGKVLQLTGDQRQTVSKFLIDEGLAKKSNIKVHGF